MDRPAGGGPGDGRGRLAGDPAAQRFVCVTESMENGPGIRARSEIEIVDRYRFVERYEIAWPGKDFELYFTNE